MNDHRPRQAHFLAMGEGACYLFCICHLAEDLTNEYVDSYAVYRHAVDEKWSDPNCFLNDPGRIMGSLYGGPSSWHVRKEGALYVCRTNEFEVLRFERPTPGKIYSHFILGDGSGGVHWDSLGESNTVRYGELVSKRIFKYVGNGILRSA